MLTAHANLHKILGTFTINVRAEILSGRGMGPEILKKRPDINYFSKSGEKRRTEILRGVVCVEGEMGGCHESQEMTSCSRDT